MRLVLAGWGLTVLLAVLVIIADPRQLGFGILLAIVAGAMGAWIWLRGSRVSLVTSLLLGLLVLLSFGSYTIENATSDDFEAMIFITDVIGAIAGLAVAVGAGYGLVEQRMRGKHATTAGETPSTKVQPRV